MQGWALLFATTGKANFFLRGPVGLVFFVHGAQKLFGWFEGAGLQATAQWFEQVLGEPAMTYAIAAGSAELLGGLALMLGLLTRVAAFSLILVMVVAIRAVHWEHGLLLQNGGFEYALVLLAACAALMFGGAGNHSLDQIIGRKLKDKDHV